MSEVLKKIKEGRILILKISRPEALNALNRDVFLNLKETFLNAKYDKETSGIILTGEGEKAFVAGADIKEFANYTPIEAFRLSQFGMEIFSLIERFPKPVIAAINGFALGGGLELAMSCHIRIASRNAKLGQPEVNLGLTPGYGGTQRLPRLVGMGRALELLLTGKAIDAEEALRIGLVNKVVEQGELLEEAKKLLNLIIEKAPLALESIINCVIFGMEAGKEAGLKLADLNFATLFSTRDMKEGVNAFIQKRKAEFIGE